MKVKAKIFPPVPVTKILESVDITLTADEAYWLVGVIGAQTDMMAVGIFDGLAYAISKETGQDRYSIHDDNEISRQAHKMATGNRKGYGEVSESREEKTVSFMYDGIVRTVANATIDSRTRLLRGFEMTRGQAPSEQYKSYRLDRIGL